MRRRNGSCGNFRVPAFRRLLVAFFAVAYLWVGFVGEIVCASEAISIGSRFDVNVAANDVDEGTKGTPTVVDHCYSCVPITVAEATQVPVPANAPIGLSFSVHTIGIWDTRLLDPPPPKHLA